MTDGGQDFNLGHVVGATGETGATGNGIQSIVLLSTLGKTKTYRITYTNGDNFDFQVKDGNDGSDASVTIVTSWNSTTSDSKVPSEKLTKTELDKKIAKSNTAGLVKNDGSIDTNSYLTSSSLSNYVQKSQTSGLLKNDGTVDASAYITSSSLPTKTSDLSNDGADGTNVFVANNDSRLTDARTPTSHTHGNLQNDGKVGTSNNASKNVVTDSNGKITTEAKPTIPTKISDLTNDSDFIEKSSTSGLIKNDGSVDTNAYITSSSLPTIQTSWGSTTSDSKVPSEKLTKDSLDGKQATLISGTNIKTINNETLLGSGNITIQGGGSSVDIVTDWESTLSDAKVPSEKLTKNTIDNELNFKLDKYKTIQSYTLSSTTQTIDSQMDENTWMVSFDYDDTYGSFTIEVGSVTNEQIQITDGGIGFDETGDWWRITLPHECHIDVLYQTRTPIYGYDVEGAITVFVDKEMRSPFVWGYYGTLAMDNKLYKVEQNSNGAVTNLQYRNLMLYDYVQKSNTTGLLKNDGTVDTTTYSTFSGSYSDLSNKPSIPSDVSELTDTQNTAFTPKSHTHGNINNDGTITTTDTGKFTYFVGVGSSNSRLYKAQYLRANQITDGNANQYSSLGSLTSGDNQQTINSAIDTALGNKVNTSDIADNLTTNDGAKVLSAKQGYLLNTLKLNISQSSAKGKNVVVNSTTGFIDFEDKPTIPSSSSDLSDGSDLVKTSSTTGLLKNDGGVMQSGTGASNWAVGNHTHSGYVSATKVTSWSSTVSDSNVPSEKLVKDYIDNQIGLAIQYIQQ